VPARPLRQDLVDGPRFDKPLSRPRLLDRLGRARALGDAFVVHRGRKNRAQVSEDHGPGRRREHVGEQLVGEQPVPLPEQEPVDRAGRQRLVTKPGHRIQQVKLLRRLTQRHPITITGPQQSMSVATPRRAPIYTAHLDDHDVRDFRCSRPCGSTMPRGRSTDVGIGWRAAGRGITPGARIRPDTTRADRRVRSARA
jgi:hypothetical protein